LTEAATAYTEEANSAAAGKVLGEQLREQLSGDPNAVIVFASSRHQYTDLLRSLKDSCRPEVLVGCSSAGEFVSAERGEGAASAIALRSVDMQFTAGIGHGLRESRKAAAREITRSFHLHSPDSGFPFGSALVLADALAGYTDELIEELSVQTAGTYRFFGGGAGDDAQFTRTHVFCDTEAYTDAAVALEIRSRKPIAVGASHGWVPEGEALRVTEADGMRLVSLNAAPAVEAFQEYAERTGQRLEVEQPIEFFLHNVLGIDTGNGFKLRVPLSINADGSINCASDIPHTRSNQPKRVRPAVQANGRPSNGSLLPGA